MAKGWVYLTVVLDWYSRKVQARRLSICIESVKEAIVRWGLPEIFNTDQDSQFTSHDFIKLLKNNDIAISMDGKGCWRDNVFVERLWHFVKYEEVYLKAYSSLTEARASLGKI